LEVEIARHIAENAGVPFQLLDVSIVGELAKNSLTDKKMVMDQEKPTDSYPNTFVPGRNLFFLTFAAVIARDLGISNLVTGVSQRITAATLIVGKRLFFLRNKPSV
jgi:7-cyano-7-deazaguanine synthase